MNFSVLMSIYSRENPKYLRQAIDSIWKNQILKPSEIVLVKDGPLTRELDEVIDGFEDELPLKVIPLKTNQGLGVALNIGLEACSNDLVARMDTDDIAVSNRFEEQVEYLMKNKDIALISSDISEFEADPRQSIGYRCVPKKHDEILKFAKRRNPMNHMAVMFRKSAVLDSGNYQTFHGYEDYYLWVRMLLKGYKAENMNLILVNARGGRSLLSRRQGMRFFKEEFRLQKEFRRLGLINYMECSTNLILRALPRLFPVFALKFLYKKLRK